MGHRFNRSVWDRFGIAFGIYITKVTSWLRSQEPTGKPCQKPNWPGRSGANQDYQYFGETGKLAIMEQSESLRNIHIAHGPQEGFGTCSVLW